MKPLWIPHRTIFPETEISEISGLAFSGNRAQYMRAVKYNILGNDF